MDYSKSAVGLALLVLALSYTCSAFDNALERLKLDGHDTHDVDIFIEQRLSYVHAMIDLKPTIAGLTILDKCIYKLDKSNNPMAKILLRNIDGRVDRIKSKVLGVVGRNVYKQKRSIETIGNLISDLFGNPGPSDWKKNNANLLIMQNAIKRLNDNSVIEHSDIDINRHDIEVQNKELRQMSTLVNENMIKLAGLDEEVGSIKIFFEILTFAEAVENQVDGLVKIKADGMKGFCSEKAINKDFLIENLQGLEANRAGLSPVFNSWEWREFYSNPVCSVAVDNEAVWVTVRIPIVRKSEKLCRVIPNQNMKEVISKVESYGFRVELFKEKENDKYHVITSASLDFCNKMGNTRTCGVRDVKFSSSSNTVVPVEFAHNRLLFVSIEPSTIKFMEKCPAGITEHILSTDSVVLLPNNCSYVSSSITVDVRVADVSITKEIGMIHFETIEVGKVENLHSNRTRSIIQEVSNFTHNLSFQTAHNEIAKQLGEIDFRHDSFLSTYWQEKWMLVGSLALAVVVYFTVKTLWSKCCKKEERSGNKIDENTEIPQIQPKSLSAQIDVSDHQSCSGEKNAEHVYTDIESSVNSSFSCPKERSQFYNK